MRDSAEREDRESKRLVSRVMVESLSALKEMKDGILRMTEHFCTPHNRDNMPNQNAQFAAVDIRPIPWRKLSLGLRTPSLGFKRTLIR